MNELMSQKYSFSRFIYLDTWVFGKLVNEPNLVPPLFDFLTRHDLCIAVSEALLLELKDATRYHEDILSLLTVLPSALVKNSETILDEEVKSYPNRRNDTLLLYPTLALGSQTFTELLSSDKLNEGRKRQKIDAKKMKHHIFSLKSNFPPSSLGKYIKEQATEFAWMITVQWLANTHTDFLQNCKNIKADVFLSLQLHAYYVYYKYYLDKREPKKLSDFGDLFHLFYIPYCKLAVLERDMSNILNKVKSHCKTLNDVEVKNIDYLNSL